MPGDVTDDFDRETRFFAFDPNATPTADMGADEVVGNLIDIDNDGKVDLYELTLLGQHWLTVGSHLPTDFNDDQIVDLADFDRLAQQWLWQGYWYLPDAAP